MRSLCLVSLLIAILLPESVRGEFSFEEYKDRLPWIWESPTKAPVPAVANKEWPADEIDTFILAALEESAMTPAPPASDRHWFRRANFAITGLPPTAGATEEFLSRDSKDRRRDAVLALLASPHYGERWARHWMDLVRYAESRGHESDFGIANAWRYRDYLVRAFNGDVPYNDFVAEHLAGDLLASPRLDPETKANESILGTGWPFLGEEVHSPVDIRQDECDRTDNKIDVLSKTFLGLTVACARCHDHMFDAIYQKDYYALSGFVASSSYRQVRYQSIEVNKTQARKLEALRAKTATQALKNFAREAAPHFAELSKKPTYRVPGPLTIKPEEGQNIRVVADYTRPGITPWITDGPSFGNGVSAEGSLVLGSNPDEPGLRIAGYGAARRDPFWNGLKITDSANDAGSFNSHSRSGKMIRTPAFELKTGRLHYLIRGNAFVYAGVGQHIMITGPLHGRLIQRPKIDGDQPRWVSHDLSRYTGLRTHIEFGAEGGSPLEVLMVVEADKPPAVEQKQLNLTRLDLSAAWKDLADGVVEKENLHAARWIVEQPKLTASQIAPSYLKELDAIRKGVKWESGLAVAWLDGNGVNEYNMDRGDPAKPLEPATRGLPRAFGLSPIDSKTSGRLELARQVTSPKNPLTARVMVNRIWHQLFGLGLVRTVDNFGWLGERPSHPELLDYLATEFVETHQWSIKSFLTRLLLTKAYGQSSISADPSFDQRDPNNVLLHRMPVRRLEAEAIRDSVLAVSGRLEPKIGGKPVPTYLDEFVVGRGRPGGGPLDGGGRRSLYTSVRRNFLPTLMLAFDFPAPFSTKGKRDITNVPAQSLALMNDKLIYEQAKIWAQKVLKEMPSATPEERLNHMFENAFTRRAGRHEIAILMESLPGLMELHGDNPNSEGLWQDLCHSLFSMNDFIYLP
ncbi:MAG: DUF1549 and DUF1553 domain-containing protein [Roseibacillus sp.]|nr:DUF1549 and DUF1553 domain-containing protein [Roseibacillus sp.]